MAGRSSVLAGSRLGFAEALAGGPGGAPDQQNPPSVVTEIPEDVTDVSATLVATLTTNDRPCLLYFRYNAQGGVSFSTGLIAVNANSAPTRVTASIQGLAAGTQHFCRAFAFQIEGPFTNLVVHGESMAFTTLPATGLTPPSVQVLAPTNVTPTTCTLNARANPNGVAAGNNTTVEIEAVNNQLGTFAITPVNIGVGTAFVDVSGDVTFTGIPPEGAEFAVTARGTSAAGSVTDGPIQLVLPPLSTGNVPTILTQQTTQVLSTLALVKATWDTGGLDCTVDFKWGLDANYGNTKSFFVLANSTQLTVALEPLAAGTTYHWNVTISNEEGQDDGDDVVFTTSSVGTPASVRTNLPTRIRDQSARLNCEVNPNASSTTVKFGIALDPGELASQAGPSYFEVDALPASATGTAFVAFAANVQGLAVGTVYYYQPRASNSGGANVPGAIGVFQTADQWQDITTPAVIMGQSSAFIETNTAQLGAGVDFQGCASSYCFEYWETAVPLVIFRTNITLVPLTGGSPPAATTLVASPIGGLIAATGYSFRILVSSMNSESIVAGTPPATFTTDGAPGNPFPTGTMDAPFNITQSAASFSGTTNPMGTTCMATFEIAAGGDPNFAVILFSSTPYNAGAGSITVPIPQQNIGGLTPNTTYLARLKLENDGGNNILYVPVNSPGYHQFSTVGPALANVTTHANPLVTQTTAQLSMAVTSIDTSEHFVRFEYGLATLPVNTYTNHTLPVSIGFGPFSGFNFQAPITQLTPNTQYQFKAFCVNAAGQSLNNDEKLFTTLNVVPATFPDPKALLTVSPEFLTQPPPPAKQYTTAPTYFYMRGQVKLNGLPASVYFQYTTDPTFATFTEIGPQVLTPTLAEFGDEPLVAEQAHFLTPSTATVESIYFWRIRAVNVNGETISGTKSGWMMPEGPYTPTGSQMTQLHRPVINTLPPYMKDDVRIVLRAKVFHKGLRHWGRFEWMTQAAFNAAGANEAAWAGSTKGRIISSKSHTQSASNGTIPNVRWYESIKNLTPATAYVARLRCWNRNGESPPTASPMWIFTTDAAASWPGTVGSQSPRGGVNWPIGRDFRNVASAPITEANEVIFGADEYTSAEEAFTIFVTPTSVSTINHAFHGTTSFPCADGVGGNPPGQRALALAFSKARIGDIIRVDSSTGHLYQGIDIGGSDSITTDATWGGPVVFKPITGVRVQPRSKAAGHFRWQGLACLAERGGFNGIAVRYCHIVRWSSDLAGWYMSGGGLYTVQTTDVGGHGYGRLIFYDCVFGVGHGPMKDVGPDVEPGLIVAGLDSSNPDHQGYGVRTHIRTNAPGSFDIRRCFFSPGQEHSLYLNSPGAFCETTTWVLDCEVKNVAIGARPGVLALVPEGPNGGGVRPHIMAAHNAGNPSIHYPWGWGDRLNYHEGQLASRNTFIQIVQRSDEVISGATGPGSPPGRGEVVVKRCILRCRPN